jgi:hypothetical protein
VYSRWPATACSSAPSRPCPAQVPVVAIGLQGLLATIIALSGRYEQILN